jgi:hypothetical protein
MVVSLFQPKRLKKWTELQLDDLIAGFVVVVLAKKGLQIKKINGTLDISSLTHKTINYVSR